MSVKRHNPHPLTSTGLEELALAYVARFATTQARLGAYLHRKLRERGWAGAGSPPVDAVVRRHVEAGHVDDAAWARMKAGSLLRRGYGARRVGEALGQAGVEEQVREEARPGESEQRRAALVMARRRRFGPFAVQIPGGAPQERQRERQIAAMLRAGHPLDIARRIVDASDPEAAEQWAESVAGDDVGDD
ncbi:regulatory protein [Novosphingobium sp. CF614]|uniref:RecX family transcriptional regulator n=1 Tax=Novosphingobium sp. CF614 TaxID=1884364 RepID=UPI0008E48519|nr:RecX family transcriptional regulator [Novosphingobium sp. CF614]SFF94431.1 regulatory protein [Novosphingobium sp. CF614]